MSLVSRQRVLVAIFVAFVFGVLRLRTRQLLMLSATAIVSFAGMVLALYWFKPGTVEPADELLELIVLAVTLPWFAAMGGYLSQLRDSMRDTNRQLEAAKTAAEGAALAKTTFLASMSHEIRTPMNAILGMLKLLQKTELDLRQADYAGKAEGAARSLFGEVLARACRSEEVEPPSDTRLATERSRLERAPTVVVVISRVVATPGAPEWEQVLSCGAACFNMCIAANALGFGTCWITEWYAYSPTVRAALSLAANERIAGFVYIGTARERQPDRERPDLASIVSRWVG